MPAARRCPQCGAAVRPDAPEGLCPECLLKEAMKGESDRAGKQEAFDRLKVYLTGEAGTPRYRDTAAELGMTEGAVRVAVHRLRRRYRDLVRDEIAQTVAGPEDVDEELRHLFAALRSPGS